MSGGPVPRAECIRAARAVLDAARRRRDIDRAAGRLAPEVELMLQRLERGQRTVSIVQRSAA